MKRSDIAMIILIASITMLIAFFATRALFGDVGTGTEKVKTVDQIDASIVEPDPTIFNKDAINPAVEVQVGIGQ